MNLQRRQPRDADHPSRWPTRMRCLRRSGAVWLRGPPSPQPRRPLGLLHPSRRGSSPERDKTMTMDHDIATSDFAALKLRKARPYLRESPTPTKTRKETGRGLLPPLSPGFRNANASPTGALSPTSGQVAPPQPSAGRSLGLFVGSIRNPNRRRSIDSKYALDAGAVSRLSFQLWISNPRIRTS
jgi:hypothetical protein